MYSSIGIAGMERKPAVRTESARAAGGAGTRVVVVILTWQSKADIGICLVALERALGADFLRSTVVVDNASTDGTADDVAARFPELELLRAERNLGFAGGNNLGIRRAIARGAEFVYLLNPDAIVRAGFLEEALAQADASVRVAAVQSLLLLAPDGRRIDSAGNVIHCFGFGYCDLHRRPVEAAPAEAREILFASGAAVLLRVSALQEVGLLDERLFLYCEDLDLSWRLLLAGYELRLAPRSVVLHRHEFGRNPGKYFLLERNRWIVLAQNLSLRSFLLLLVPLLATEVGLLAIAARSGWLGEKLRANLAFCAPRSLAATWRGRRAAQALRRRPDREVVGRFVARMEFDGEETPLLRRWVNPVLERLWRRLRRWL